MKGVNPLWHPAQQLAYTEVALKVCAIGDGLSLTPRTIVTLLGEEALEYIKGLPYGYDVTPANYFYEEIHAYGIVQYDRNTHKHSLGGMGRILVDAFLEEWAGEP